ncbi:hypothetical protein GGC64_006272 [Mycobacterium sp. OAS707]|nr:hypothetical protein [Mycobacterium sp. OAS707]
MQAAGGPPGRLTSFWQRDFTYSAYPLTPLLARGGVARARVIGAAAGTSQIDEPRGQGENRDAVTLGCVDKLVQGGIDVAPVQHDQYSLGRIEVSTRMQ